MPNIKGGKKHKRNKNHNPAEKTLRLKEEGQEYAQITRCKGNCRFDVLCFDGKKRMAIMCGAMRKRKFVNANDIVLVSLREWQDSICDIIDNYDENLTRKLKEKGLKLEFDSRNEKINYKIREHSHKKVPVIFIIGEKEEKENSVTIRELSVENQKFLEIDKAIQYIKKKI